MEFKKILEGFYNHNISNLKRIIIYLILILFFGFLAIYNIYRIGFSYSAELSWFYGGLTTIIFSFVMILIIDVLWFIYKGYR